MDNLTVGLAIIAVVRALKEIPNLPMQGVVTIAVAVVLGGVAGYLHIEGLDVVSGIMAGLAAVGISTTADRVGNTAAVK